MDRIDAIKRKSAAQLVFGDAAHHGGKPGGWELSPQAARWFSKRCEYRAGNAISSSYCQYSSTSLVKVESLAIIFGGRRHSCQTVSAVLMRSTRILAVLISTGVLSSFLTFFSLLDEELDEELVEEIEEVEELDKEIDEVEELKEVPTRSYEEEK